MGAFAMLTAREFSEVRFSPICADRNPLPDFIVVSMQGKSGTGKNGKDPTVIAIVLHNSQFRYLLVGLAEELRTRNAAKIYLYCRDSEKARYMKSVAGEGVFDEIIDAGIQFTAIKQKSLTVKEVFERAKTAETKIGSTVNEIAAGSRHLGRGFAMSGPYHPRSHQSESTSYLQMVHGIVSEIDFWRDEFVEKNISVVVEGGRVVADVARSLDIPFRVVFTSRTKNLHYWATTITGESPAIEENYTHRSTADELIKVDEPYFAHMTLRVEFLKSITVYGTIGRMAKSITNQILWRLRQDPKGREYFLSSMIRLHFRRWLDYRREMRLGANLESLEGKRFVFFPLQTDPEIGLQVHSPEFFFQHAAIVALARDLPADTLLVVKDTYEALGRRPKDFYRQIRDLKNVVMVDPIELGLKIVDKAVAVALICGTVGFEAATPGKPVISFGRHNLYVILRQVFLVDSFDDVKLALDKALSGDFDSQKARSDGQKFLSAVIEESFDMGDYDHIHFDKFDRQIMADAATSLIDGLPKISLQSATT